MIDLFCQAGILSRRGTGEVIGLATRSNDPDGMRQKILDAAFDAFTKEGYNATSMHRLKADASVSGGAFSHHFPTKKSLGLAVIRDRVSEAIEQNWIEPILDAPDVIAGIDQAVASLANELDGKGAVSGCPLGNLAAELSALDAEFRQEMEPLYTRWREAIAARISSDSVSDRARDPDPNEIATMIVATITGALTMAKVSQSSQPLRHAWAQMRRQLKTSGEASSGGPDSRGRAADGRVPRTDQGT